MVKLLDFLPSDLELGNQMVLLRAARAAFDSKAKVVLEKIFQVLNVQSKGELQEFGYLLVSSYNYQKYEVFKKLLLELERNMFIPYKGGNEEVLKNISPYSLVKHFVNMRDAPTAFGVMEFLPITFVISDIEVWLHPWLALYVKCNIYSNKEADIIDSYIAKIIERFCVEMSSEQVDYIMQLAEVFYRIFDASFVKEVALCAAKSGLVAAEDENLQKILKLARSAEDKELVDILVREWPELAFFSGAKSKLSIAEGVLSSELSNCEIEEEIQEAGSLYELVEE